MLAKLPDARETRDIDLLGTTSDLDAALDKLKKLASTDLGDFIDFRFEKAVPTDTSQDYRTGCTATFSVWLGGTSRRGTISVDLVVDTMPMVDYDLVDSVSRLDIEGLETHLYAITKSAARVAEKVGATMQGYNGRPSSRVKDLADLVKTMLEEDVDGEALVRLLHFELTVRGIGAVDRFEVPATWKTTMAANYRKLAWESCLPEQYESVTEAERTIAAWLQPAIDGKASDMTWRATGQKWQIKADRKI